MTSLLAALVFAGNVSASVAAWQKLEDLPAPNGGLVCGEADGKIVVVGGTNWETRPKKNWLRDVLQFDPAAGHWKRLGVLSQPFAYGLAATIDRAVVVIGGSTGAAPFAGTIRVKKSRVSEQPTGGVSIPAVLSAGGLIDDEIVFAGGSDDAANLKGFTTQTYAWNVRTDAIRTLAASPGPGFGIAASAVVNRNLYVFGGAAFDPAPPGVVNLSRAMVYSSRTNQWKELKSTPAALRGTTALALDERHIYLGGGFGSDFTDQGWIYDVVDDSYRPAPPLPYKSLAHLVRVGEFVYCLGGEDGQKHRSQAAYRIRVADLLPAR